MDQAVNGSRQYGYGQLRSRAGIHWVDFEKVFHLIANRRSTTRAYAHTRSTTKHMHTKRPTVEAMPRKGNRTQTHTTHTHPPQFKKGWEDTSKRRDGLSSHAMTRMRRTLRSDPESMDELRHVSTTYENAKLQVDGKLSRRADA